MNTRIQDNNTNHGGRFLMALITGSAIGAALAIYFAPRLALELRQRVTDSTTGLRNAASERFQGVATRVADVVERVADVADDVTRRGQAARDDVKLKKGAHVEVTVTAEPKTSTDTIVQSGTADRSRRV